MKQAILITAYKNYHHLEEIINFFDSNFEVYIHIDKKSKISNVELNNLREYDIVKLVSQKYEVNWGGFNHLKSILYLIEQSIKSPENSSFHLISGHDFPIKSKSYFIDFFTKNSDVEFINYFNFPNARWIGNEGMDRIEHFNLYDIFNAKILKEDVKIKRFVQLQKKIGLKRSISSRMPKLFGGSTWWSLSRECVLYIIEFTENNKFVLNRFKYTLCSEEFYFQTVIMNSDFASKVVNDDLRYIDWVARNGNNPAILDETDYEKITQTNAIFARKFEYPHSIGVMNRIKTFIK